MVPGTISPSEPFPPPTLLHVEKEAQEAQAEGQYGKDSRGVLCDGAYRRRKGKEN